jgi:hypothetical protein
MTSGAPKTNAADKRTAVKNAWHKAPADTKTDSVLKVRT